MIHFVTSLALGLVVAGASCLQANAQQLVRLGIELSDNGAERYEVSLLKLALEHSGEDAVLEVIPLGDTSQDRALIEFEQGRSSYNIIYSGGSIDREQRFHQIDIPLSRGLLGHRIFITRKEQPDQLAQIRTLEEFRKYAVIGSGIGWPDTEVFRAAGFNVVATEWMNIWRMLSLGRINVFNRGLHEPHSEIKKYSKLFPNLIIDTNVMVKYRFGFFFYVQKGNMALADLVQRGLENAYASGAFMDHFYAHPRIKAALGHVQNTDLVVFDILNPLLSERQRAIPDHYWHEIN